MLKSNEEFQGDEVVLINGDRENMEICVTARKPLMAKFLHLLLQHYHRETLLVMAGFIIGSLVKVWPWSDMQTVILSQYPQLRPVDGLLSPEIIAEYSGLIDYHVAGAVIFALVGFLLVVGIEVASSMITKKSRG